MASQSPYVNISDLTGGINDSDSPFALEPTQVVYARNLDFRAGNIGTKRPGMTPVVMTGSVFQRDRVTRETVNTGGWLATAGGTVALSAIGAPADGSLNTNHALAIWIVTNAASNSTAVTVAGSAAALITRVANGAGGQIELWVFIPPPLAGGNVVFTLAAAVDASVVIERWGNVDNGIGFTNTTTGTATGLAVTEINNTVALSSTQMFIVGMGAAGALTATSVPGGGGTLSQYTGANFQNNGAAYIGVQSALGMLQGAGTLWNIAGSGNIEFIRVHLTGRIALLNANLTLVGMWRHRPSNNITEDELWVIDKWGRIDRNVNGVWVGGVNTPNLGVGSFGLTDEGTNGISLHRKFFLAVSGGVYADRLLVYDRVTALLRWAGLAAPAIVTAANTAPAGTFATTRYYRIRWTEQQAGVTTRRSEPSPSLSFTPSGANTGVTVTRSTSGSVSSSGVAWFEGQTHWELEASTDNVLFYRIATTILATTTATDTAPFLGVTTYTAFPLSESIGLYVPMPAVRHVFNDEDRLMGAGSMAGIFTDVMKDSRVYWTELGAVDGVNNDERVPVATSTSRHFMDLDSAAGGRITMVLTGAIGAIYAFKDGRSYKLFRTGSPKNAYNSQIESRARGTSLRAGTVAIDSNGQPCAYFYDPSNGVCRFSTNGIQDLMQKRRRLVELVNLAAPYPALLFFDPKNWLVITFLRTSGSLMPNYAAVFNIRTSAWTDYTGPLATTCAATLFPSLTTAQLLTYFAPCTQGTSVLTIGNAGVTDDGVNYRAYITTKPMQLGQLYKKFGVMAAVLFAKVSASTIGLGLVRNLYLERKDVTTSIAAVGTEDYAVRPMDDARMSECNFIQFELGDPPTFAGAQLNQTWTLDELAVKIRGEDESTS